MCIRDRENIEELVNGMSDFCAQRQEEGNPNVLLGCLLYTSRDMQDMEFTVQEGKLWFLQTRNGKRTGRLVVDNLDTLCRRIAGGRCV